MYKIKDRQLKIDREKLKIDRERKTRMCEGLEGSENRVCPGNFEQLAMV